MILASYHPTVIMPAKKGRYTAKAACARAGKAALHRVQTPISSAPPSSKDNGPDDSDFPDLHHSSADRCKHDATMCCTKQILELQLDFKEQRSLVQEVIGAAGHLCIFFAQVSL